MSNLELKPCPFCGNPKPYLHQEEYDKTLWIIICKNCHSEFTVGRKRRLVNDRTYTGELISNHDDVIDVWNRRADNERPAADVRPERHGEWEPIKDIIGGTLFQCSNCKIHITPFEHINANYCKYCGAKMDGEDGEQK